MSNGFKAELTPEAFLKQLNIKPMSSNEFLSKFNNLGNQVAVRALRKAMEKGDDNGARRIIFSDIELMKLTCSGRYAELCGQAHLLKRTPVPPESSILIIGGDDALFLSLWIAALRSCQVTCLHPFYHLGIKWAQQIGENRVTFIDANLSNLRNQEHNKFNVVLLAKGWPGVLGDGLPEKVSFPGCGDQPSNETDKRIMEFFSILDQVSTPDGLLIFQDLLEPYDLGSASIELDVNGIFPNWKLIMILDGDNTSNTIFGKLAVPAFLENTLSDLAVKKIDTGQMYFGQPALVIQNFFNGARTVMVLEYEWLTNSVTVKVEILQKNGAGLLYKTNSTGSRSAIAMPASKIQAQVKHFESFVDDRADEGFVRIIRKYPA